MMDEEIVPIPRSQLLATVRKYGIGAVDQVLGDFDSVLMSDGELSRSHLVDLTLPGQVRIRLSVKLDRIDLG